MIKQSMYIVTFCILFIGAGCVNNPNTTTNQQQTPQLTDLQQAYVHCLEQGFKTSLNFDEDEGRLKLLCVFDEQESCDAISFFEETCSPTKKVRIAEHHEEGHPLDTLEEEETDENSIYSCGKHIDPVCGVDTFTYANACVAESQKIDIYHNGACEDVQQLLEADDATEPIPEKKSKTRNTKQKNNTSSNSLNTKETSSEEESTDSDMLWIDTLIAFAKKETSQSPVSIQSCPIGGKTFYHKKGDMSVLYTDSGDVACFPNNDLKNFCPKELKTTSCTTIWKK